MSDENKINRRQALKVIALGVGAGATLPLLENATLGQHAHAGAATASGATVAQVATEPRFFTAQEFAVISAISEQIIPADEHSPGALAANVPAFIDMMVNESPLEVKNVWRQGIAILEAMSRKKFSVGFAEAKTDQQIALLKTISRNERAPKKTEERFFNAIKSLTVDGYYTSPIGIHQELQYKGNTYLKEFVGCTHPEHIG